MPEIHIQAFADDLIGSSDNIKTLQNLYNKIDEKLKKINLEINFEKCDLLSDDVDDFITEPHTERVIMSKSQTKYLGQYINSKGQVSVSFEKKMFGKVLQLLENYKELTRRS